MPLKNTAESYGTIAKTLHWVSAGLFLISYCSIYYREWLAETDLENWAAIQLHFSVGFTVLVVTLLRIIWRLLNRQPELGFTFSFKRLAIRIGHYLLYVILIIMPISGYLSIADYLASGSGSVSYFLMFEMTSLKDIQLFESIGLTLKQLEDPADSVHSFLGSWIVWLLVVGHISAALYHHFIGKDRTLSKMTFHRTD